MFWCYGKKSLKFYQFAFWMRKLFCILQVKDIQQTFGHHTSLCSYVSISFLAHLSLRPKWALSVVLRRWRRRCRKLFIFSSSSPEPLFQSQPNLAQCILGWWGLKFVQMKGPTFYQGEIIAHGPLVNKYPLSFLIYRWWTGYHDYGPHTHFSNPR